MKRCVIYTRVSTEDQAKDTDTSLDDQERRCRAYAESKEWGVVGVYRENGFTGTTDDRPEWNRLVAACRAGRADVVVLTKWDRLARNAEVGLRIVRQLDELHAGLVVIEADIDTTGTFGRMIRLILLGLAEWNRDTIIEQLTAGAYAAARAGYWPTSYGSAPTGLRAVPTPDGEHLVLALDEREAEVIREAARLLADERLELTLAVNQLNARGLLTRNGVPWTRDNLRKVMSAPARYGEVFWGKTADEGGEAKRGMEKVRIAAPAVLTRERWEEVQPFLEPRVANPREGQRFYLLSGLLDSPCGRGYIGVKQPGRAPQYRCRGVHRHRNSVACTTATCPRLDAASTEAMVWAGVSELLASPPRLQVLAETFAGRAAGNDERQRGALAAAQRQARQLKDELPERVAGYLEQGMSPELAAQAVARIEAKITGLEQQAAEISGSITRDREARDQVKLLDDLAGRDPASMRPMEQREVLEQLGFRARVLVRAGKVELEATGSVVSGDTSREARWSPSGRVPPVELMTVTLGGRRVRAA